jgi:hypothetical protein
MTAPLISAFADRQTMFVMGSHQSDNQDRVPGSLADQQQEEVDLSVEIGNHARQLQHALGSTEGSFPFA